MKLFVVSGDGIGAGKSTFCKRMCDETWSLAGALRQDLRRNFPAYDWFNKDQAYKNTDFREVEKLETLLGLNIARRMTIRDVLILYGQVKCSNDPVYWVRELCSVLIPRVQLADGVDIIGIDDLRKVCELEYFKATFPRDLVHFHIISSQAIEEPEFENQKLKQLADYTLAWNPKV